MSIWRNFIPWRRPTNFRHWAKDMAVLPEINFNDDDTITINNIRHATYRNTKDYEVNFYDKTIEPKDVIRVWFMVEPFSLLAAHTLLSFEFKDGSYLTISVEIRKKHGQSFSQLLVLFFLRRHELMYVIGDERDLIKLRTNYRRDNVYLYPVKADQKHVQKLFINMLKRAVKLQHKPEFYNPFTNTCLSNIVDHVNEIRPGRIPFNYQLVIATLADRYAHKLGLLAGENDFPSLKQRHHINQQALEFADDPDFSNKIRLINK
jgi:hypothetical protein